LQERLPAAKVLLFSKEGAVYKVAQVNAFPLPLWTIAAPIAALLLFASSTFFIGSIYLILMTLGVFAAVMAAVHHAEVVAHRVGEPYGTLVLALAVTLIEVALIVSLMIAGGADATALARDTVFAAVMIILNGIVGLSLLIGGLRHREQLFSLDGTGAALTTLVAIVVLTLILPNFTTSVAGPFYNKNQLIFIAIVSLVLYGTFVLVQTVRHRGYFLSLDGNSDIHSPPSTKIATLSFSLLLCCLIAVVLLAKKIAPSIEMAIDNLGAPKALVGIIIAAVVLLPEGLAAVRAAQKNQLQTSLNLALGSALASIGLTIPAVAIVSLYTDLKLTLGIDTESMVLLLLSLFVTVIALKTGKTTILQGVVLLVIFAVYLFTTIVP
jgi:Ca2+:H+ antiporter